MRQPEEIIHKGKTLREIIDLHGDWRRCNEGGVRADLRDAVLRDADLSGDDLYEADLTYAILSGADLSYTNLNYANLSNAVLGDAVLSKTKLRGTIGNMREVRSMQVDKWPVTWITAPDGTVTVQIGCQRHPLEMWRKSDPRWIATLDGGATEWWAKHRDLVIGMVDACPATPYGGERDA